MLQEATGTSAQGGGGVLGRVLGTVLGDVQRAALGSRLVKGTSLLDEVLRRSGSTPLVLVPAGYGSKAQQPQAAGGIEARAAPAAAVEGDVVEGKETAEASGGAA